jgi:methionine-rich copper-binding protein CopC
MPPMSSVARLNRRGLVASLTLLLTLLVPRTLLAHAILIRSTPANHGTVKPGPLAVELHFNSRVDGARSRLTLTLASDATMAKPLSLKPLTQAAPDTLTTTSVALAPGDYILHWIALATDGHISRGEVRFSVK